MISINDLTIEFPQFKLGEISLEIGQGEFFALMGPTGSGKTLILESISGMTKITSGNIAIDGRDVTALPPEQRRIGLVYQDHALFPHMNVSRNITYGCKYHGIGKIEAEKTAQNLMEILGLDHIANRLPANLSGGEKQRTALARALAFKPSVLLLDEPLSSLDPQFREDVRRTLSELHAASKTTFIMVTHDFVDAMTLAGKAAVIRKGKIEQMGQVREIFRSPATEFTARFVGMKNILPASYDGDICKISCATIPNAPETKGNRKGIAAIRPEDVCISSNGDHPDSHIAIQGRIRRIFREGFSWAAEVDSDCGLITARLERSQVLDGNIPEGRTVKACFLPEKVHHIIG